MLPETKSGKASYLESRDYRSRWRKNDLEFHGEEGVRKKAVWALALEVELAPLKEQVDFMTEEGYLSPTQIDAAENCFGWAKLLLDTIPEPER